MIRTLCALPFAVLKQYVQFTSISREDFRIYKGFQCVQHHWFNIIQPSIKSVYLLTGRQAHMTISENRGRFYLGQKFKNTKFLYMSHLVLQNGLQSSKLKGQGVCL